MTDKINNGFPPGYDPFALAGGHHPNSFPLKERVERSLLAIVLIIYGGIGVSIDDLYIPGKRSKGIHMHGVSAWIMYVAMLCGAAVLLSVVIDHYDRRNNEDRYASFQKYTKVVAWFFFGFALVNQIVHILK